VLLATGPELLPHRGDPFDILVGFSSDDRFSGALRSAISEWNTADRNTRALR
jgi:hypothetical protein